MADACKEGQWVEVYSVVLKPEERSKDVPSDTKQVPFECWIKGWALSPATIGTKMSVKTPAGRVVKGTLTRINPGYTHTFGPGVPELSGIGQELRSMLKEVD